MANSPTKPLQRFICNRASIPILECLPTGTNLFRIE